MGQVVFQHQGKEHTVSFQDGDTLLAVARREGLLLPSPCNGNGTCGKCKVHVQQEGETAREVLACHTESAEGMHIVIPEGKDGSQVQILQEGHALSVDVKSRLRKEYVAAEDFTQIWAGEALLGIEAGNTSNELYGVVVDIGTTTLVTALFDLQSGRELAATSALNPQSHHAQDVLSRIRLASEDEGLELLHGQFIDILNEMTQQVAAKASVLRQSIYEFIFSGNTCMLHLAVKETPASLGKFPYTPVVEGDCYYQAAALGLEASSFAQVYLPPVLSAYVGADITSGVLAAGLAERQGITLFVDIGTNGEMVLAADGKLIATSTAAGPAFEGMNISCGMRAAPGAVEKFTVTEDGPVALTIGKQPPVGICGSGLLDIVGQLVRHKAIGGNGKLSGGKAAAALQDSLIEVDGKLAFQVASGVHLSQKDVRQVQLAKGAVRAGIEALLNGCGVAAADVDKVLIAGSFGYHLNPESLLDIGLLPPETAGKIEFLGNTSKTGGQALLLNEDLRLDMAQVVEGAQVLELATTKDFDRLFVQCLAF